MFKKSSLVIIVSETQKKFKAVFCVLQNKVLMSLGFDQWAFAQHASEEEDSVNAVELTRGYDTSNHNFFNLCPKGKLHVLDS